MGSTSNQNEIFENVEGDKILYEDDKSHISMTTENGTQTKRNK